MKPGGFYDWDYMVERLVAEEPFWEPGTRYGYHALTSGFLVGEVVRRVTSQHLGAFFAAEVARSLGLDLFIGRPESEHARVASFLPAPMPQPGDLVSPYMLQAMTEPESIPWLVMQNNGGYLVPGEWDSSAGGRAAVVRGRRQRPQPRVDVPRPRPRPARIGRFTLEPEDVARMGAVQSAVGSDAVLLGLAGGRTASTKVQRRRAASNRLLGSR